MTQQQLISKTSKLLNVNTILTGLIAAALLWIGTMQVKIYKAVLLQPGIDAVQTNAIIDLKQETSGLKNEQTRQGGRLIYLEAVMPKHDFKLSK